MVVWAVALAIWRFGHIEERWSRSLRGAAAAPRAGLEVLGVVDRATPEVVPQASETR